MDNNTFIAVDFETATYDRMACQIGITIVENGEIKDTIVQLIQPPHNYYDLNCVKVHHITPEKTANAPTFDKLWPKLEPLFTSYIAVAHNASFDESVLRKNLDYYGISHNKILPFFCTYDIYGLSLENLCKAFHMPIEGHHDAGFDSLCCAKFFLNFSNHVRPDMSLDFTEPKEKTKTSSSNQLKGDLLKKDLTNADTENPFYNKKVVITGVFTIDRDVLAAKFKTMGADVNSSISKKTNYVIIGDAPGPAKMEKLDSLIAEGCNIRKLYQCDIDEIFAGNLEKYK